MPVFGEMPELIADGTIELSRFSYNHERREFTNGASQYPLLGEDTYKGLLFIDCATVPVEEIPSVPVLTNIFGNQVTTPKFYTWLRDMDDESILDETAVVIHEAFSELRGVNLGATERGVSHMSADVNFLREGHLFLQTVGNCACLGVSVDSHVVDYNEWGSGYAAYEFHNIDFPAQHISLLAGLGHLAALCEADS